MLHAPTDSLGDYDVIVAGGGPAGVAAAVAAARQGARTLLLEQTGCLGGVATNALCGVWLGSWSRDMKFPVVGGLFDEIVGRLAGMGAAIRAADDVVSGSRHAGYAEWHGRTVPFEFEPCKLVLDRMTKEYGVSLRLFTTVVQADTADGRIARLIVHGKSGFHEVRAGAYVDATGDGDVAFSAGCPTVKGRPEDGQMTPASLLFVVEDADSLAFARYCKETGDNRFRNVVSRLRAVGQWPFDFEVIICLEMLHRGSFIVNTLRQCGIDGTDEQSLTRGMTEGREQTFALFEILRRHVPGFASARITQTAPVIGIRETRRIVGQCTLSEEDLISGRTFDDTIALSGYQWDLPDPKRPSHQPMKDRVMARPYTEIPYRALLPEKVDNLIVAGRCISTTWHALGPVRIMPACFAMGEAAGTAAARAAFTGAPLADVDTSWLRTQIERHGGILQPREAGSGQDL